MAQTSVCALVAAVQLKTAQAEACATFAARRRLATAFTDGVDEVGSEVEDAL